MVSSTVLLIQSNLLTYRQYLADKLCYIYTALERSGNVEKHRGFSEKEFRDCDTISMYVQVEDYDSIHIIPVDGAKCLINGFGCCDEWYNERDLEAVARFAGYMEKFDCLRINYHKGGEIVNTEYYGLDYDVRINNIKKYDGVGIECVWMGANESSSSSTCSGVDEVDVAFDLV